MIEDENVAITPDYLAIEVAIDGLNASQATIKKAKTVFASMGIDGIFGRSDIAAITSDSVTAAGNLITKLKKADLIYETKYKNFIYYELNLSILDETILWLNELRGGTDHEI